VDEQKSAGATKPTTPTPSPSPDPDPILKDFPEIDKREKQQQKEREKQNK
jgi:hypothetical protein